MDMLAGKVKMTQVSEAPATTPDHAHSCERQ
jgi:hypothetical protein